MFKAPPKTTEVQIETDNSKKRTQQELTKVHTEDKNQSSPLKTEEPASKLQKRLRRNFDDEESKDQPKVQSPQKLAVLSEPIITDQ